MEQSLTVVCMLWGRWGGRNPFQYVERLHNMVKKNLTVPFEFLCITDRTATYEFGQSNGIKIAPLPEEISNWDFNLPKFYVHKPLEVLLGRRILFFDLDTIIVGNIDNFAEYDGYFCGIEPFNPKRAGGHIGGGVMAFENGTTEFLWEMVSEDPENWSKDSQGGKERIILRSIEQKLGIIWDRWQFLFPKQLVSFKRHCKGGRILPKKAKIVAFHGNPKPHQAIGSQLVKEYWK